MRFISYIKSGQPSFGVLDSSGEHIIDLGRRLGASDLGHALNHHGTDRVRNLAVTEAADFPTAHIEAYRPTVADPRAIFCVGLNYDEHRVETGRAPTGFPTIFLRLASSQVGHRQALLCPAESDCLDFEGEIAVVISRGGRRIAPEHAWDHILGLAPYNDGSVRDWQAHTTQWASGKNFPATGAFGPHLVTTDEIGAEDVLQLTTEVNNRPLQAADTSMLTFPIPELVSYVSTFTPLMPGDVIVTGTPGGVGFKRNPPVFLKDGDSVSVHVSKVGRLTNVVRKERVR